MLTERTVMLSVKLYGSGVYLQQSVLIQTWQLWGAGTHMVQHCNQFQSAWPEYGGDSLQLESCSVAIQVRVNRQRSSLFCRSCSVCNP